MTLQYHALVEITPFAAVAKSFIILWTKHDKLRIQRRRYRQLGTVSKNINIGGEDRILWLMYPLQLWRLLQIWINLNSSMDKELDPI